jgi:hypothetical protein
VHLSAGPECDPKGLWLAQDGAHVKVGPCGGALCATIATPRSAVDPETGRPWTDKNNPDPGQRGRPLVGCKKPQKNLSASRMPVICKSYTSQVIIFAAATDS